MTMTVSTFDEANQRFRDPQHPQRYNSGTLVSLARVVRQLDADNFPPSVGLTGPHRCISTTTASAPPCEASPLPSASAHAVAARPQPRQEQ